MTLAAAIRLGPREGAVLRVRPHVDPRSSEDRRRFERALRRAQDARAARHAQRSLFADHEEARQQ